MATLNAAKKRTVRINGCVASAQAAKYADVDVIAAYPIRPYTATMMALAGHMTHEMLEHYSHVRMAAKREALEKLSGGLMKTTPEQQQAATEAVN